MKFDKKFIQPAIALISLIALFVFPFVTNSVAGYSAGSLNGFTVAMNTYIGAFMIILPLILLVAPVVPKYQEKLPILSVATPVLCVAAWLLCVLFAKTFVAHLADSKLAIGAYITLICYIALGVYGFITYRSTVTEIIKKFKDKEK